MVRKDKQVSTRELLSLYVRSYKDIDKHAPGILAAYILYAVVSASIPYATIYLSAQINNELAGERRLEQLWFWVMLTIGIESLLALLNGILARWKNVKMELFERRQQLFMDKMLDMDYADVDKQENRDLYAQIQQNENWAGRGLWRVMLHGEQMFKGFFGIMGAAALTVSLFMTLVPEDTGRYTVLNHPIFICGVIVLLLIVTMIGPVCANILSEEMANTAKQATFANRLYARFFNIGSNPSKAMDLRMYDQVKLVDEYLRIAVKEGYVRVLNKIFAGKVGILNAFGKGVSAIFTGMIYLFVCLKSWAGAFGIGSITQYVSSVTALSRNMASLVETLGDMRSNASFLQTTYQFLDIPNNMYQGSLPTEKRRDRQYEVEFKDVSFKYPGSEIWALRHVSMKFKVGNRLAVVGENGSGKTTFIKLLCRLYDPQEGQILLNGIDIRKYNYRDYMNVFSVVFQDFQLVSQPLGANVAGCMEYDRAKVERCLVDAGFGERLKDLPKGLDTYLYKDFAEDGVDVSGGEAQKIAIARALYKDAPFIILDEPTASLDPIAEAEIYSKFNDIAGDKTAIYISHRLSSCKFCDEIAVFHEGAVIQQGSHEELVADESGKYYELWHAQAQYYTKQEA